MLLRIAKTFALLSSILPLASFAQISDEDAIEKIILEILAKNSEQVKAYNNGKDKLFGFFVGQVMKATQGKANPKSVNLILKKALSNEHT